MAERKQQASVTKTLDPQTLKQIGHEARKPLVSLICTADLLLAGLEAELPEQTRRDVEAMKANAEHGLQAIDRMIDTLREINDDCCQVLSLNS